jgi:(2Fe-2S) ferredoxin
MSTWNLEGTIRHVLICNGGSCLKMGAEEVTTAIRLEIAAVGADHFIHTTRTRCNGRCDDRCVVIVYPDGVWYRNMTPEDAPRLVRDHLIDGNPLYDMSVYTFETQLQASGRSSVGERKPS